MYDRDQHGRLLSEALGHLLGKAEKGAMAYVRCLAPGIIAELAADPAFRLDDWEVLRIADAAHEDRTVTADQAVEIREGKGNPVLLLVDTTRAGAGMDGIYSAAREIDEDSLYGEAGDHALREIRYRQSAETHRYAEQAIRKAKRTSNRTLSPWAGFDFLCRVAKGEKSPGAYLHLLGLWPVLDSREPDFSRGLESSRLFTHRLLGTDGASQPPPIRIEAMQLEHDSDEGLARLEEFLCFADTKPTQKVLAQLAENEVLWIGPLRQRQGRQEITGVEIVPWRSKAGKILKWSGLTEKDGPNAPPVLVLHKDGEEASRSTTLEVRWKSVPADLDKGSVEYRIAIKADMDEGLAVEHAPHSGRQGGERCQFGNESFELVGENSLVTAKVVIEVVGVQGIERQESEEFVIRYDDDPVPVPSETAANVRTFSEGLAELSSRDSVREITGAMGEHVRPDRRKGLFVLRTQPEGGRVRNFRVLHPALVSTVEEDWVMKEGTIGRWRVKVRSSGDRHTKPTFESVDGDGGPEWEQTRKASRRMAKRFEISGGAGQVYDESVESAHQVVHEYLRAWIALLEKGDPALALANTVEVRSLSDKVIGLIVLPSHPVRVAWHVAYDNLVLHTAFEQKAKQIRKMLQEFACLDGALFPAFLPNPAGGTFVFGDTLGFHAIGMVPDNDPEPKASVALLARAMGEKGTVETAPTVGAKSAGVLGQEITKYLDCHKIGDLLRVHALRAGEGRTVSRALGQVLEQRRQDADIRDDGESDDGRDDRNLTFALDLYPSQAQQGIAGRFIAEAREKRRSGAGRPVAGDQWMLESLILPGGITIPRLRWARKETSEPESRAAHVAVAFDTFESCTVIGADPSEGKTPCHAFGLLAFYQRRFAGVPDPHWTGSVPCAAEGEKHPSRRTHTENLSRIQGVVQRAVARHLGAEEGIPLLKTAISREKEASLAKLHKISDWVVTLDRNAGLEYFDSPRDRREIYDAYVIDAVPEREDLGCLQLITSTANLDEVRGMLDDALDRMGMSRSLKNAAFLLEQLKALSGRLAIRLTGHKPASAELVALAISYANCLKAEVTDECWVGLREGFIIPADDVRDLLPALAAAKPGEKGDETAVGGHRPDLVYVTMAPRKGLLFRFIEVKYRRHLRSARAPDVLDQIHLQTRAFRKRWEEAYGLHETCASFRAIRRAKLARVLRFYVDKAHRHGLPDERHRDLVAEIDRMVARGKDYEFHVEPRCDRGWVFCPEYAGRQPLEISPDGWQTRVFLFGPTQFSGGAAPSGVAPPPPPEAAPSTQPPDEVSAALVPQESQATTPDTSPATAPEDPAPSIVLGADVVSGAEVGWSLGTRGNPHLMVVGLPGMGKTHSLVRLCEQMVAANVCPVVFSFHQDIDERLGESLGPPRFVDFDGLGFNPLQVLDRSAKWAHLDVVGAVGDIFGAIFPDLGEVQQQTLREAIKQSFKEAGWELGQTAGTEPAFGRFVEILRQHPKPDRGLKTLLARLGELHDYGFFAEAESRGSLWDSAHPAVVRIHTTQNDNLQRAFAALVFYGLYKDMFRRGPQGRITHALIFDEAHRAAQMKLIPTMAKECRKYGISLVLASQEAKDFDVSLFSAVANYLVLRCNEADAKFLVRNVSDSRQERGLIDRIKQMGKHKALYFAEGQGRPSQVALSP